MKRPLLLLNLLLIFILNNAFGQAGEWVWIHGNNTANNSGSFGVKGVPSPTNEPPSLYEPCEWTDLNGNFWLFGGTGPAGVYSALWKYSPSINEWTWMSGLSTGSDTGNFGIRGIPSPLNRPSSRGYGVASWVDLNGNLWMFNTNQSDLWKYNITTNEWTWMKGSKVLWQPGVYGTKGVPDTANFPGARSECSAAWTDNAGDLWMFGGYDGSSVFNDMWRYNIAGNSWTWMKGSNMPNQNGIYGTQGIEDPFNTPGSRAGYCHWKDLNGNLWLYAGYDWGANNNFSDLWRFNVTTNNWTCMNGNMAFNSPGVYGNKCIPSMSNTPGQRWEDRTMWTDQNGDLWLFGGGLHSAFDVWNDIWKYCMATNQWIWIAGDNNMNPIGNWGTLGVSNINNKPDGRFGSIGWTDHNNHLYVFGGSSQGFNLHNDLWKYTIDTTCAPCSANIIPPIANFVSNDSSVCSGDCLNFTNFSQHSNSYQWFFPGGTPSSDTSANPHGICYFNSGTFDVTLIATNNIGSDTLTLANFITIYPQVPFSALTQNGDTLFSIPGYPSYEWYDGSTIIPGATNYNYVATHSGNYSVVVTDSNGCFATAQMLNVIASVNDINSDNIDLNVQYSSGNILLKINSSNTSLSDIEITDGIGKIIYQKKISIEKGKNEMEILGLNLSEGVYYIELMNSKEVMTGKIYIQLK